MIFSVSVRLLQALIGRVTETLRELSTNYGRIALIEFADDVGVAEQFKPLSNEEIATLRQRAEEIKGPSLEDWKPNVETRTGMASDPFTSLAHG
jgi:hypothetical protein